MDLLLQIWGGGFYLLNKVFFAFAEGKAETTKRKLKILGWSIYILGVPAWVIILVGKHDWIAASIEAGGLPAMLFGLCNVYQNTETPNKIFDFIASCFTYAFLILGVCYSVYDYGGLPSVSQFLETGVMVGFLIGSYLLAKNSVYGWLFFMLMNGSMGSLMWIQDKPILAAQQAVSLCFVIYGFTVAMKTARPSI
ncbi:hypothetical protein D3OALGA1CA_5051 [Olavius algarvensis associated proteobacterium Delta 3]|nr:hypothetical protein D3OALGA1CA_5051 [Olavius algarvensis associated proteobacterium Delta 3]